MSKHGNLRLVHSQEGSDVKEHTEMDDDTDIDQSENEGEAEGECKDIELGSDTVQFLDPETLLKMLLGFHKAKEGSDYEIATRKLKDLCYEEVQRRMKSEYKYRGCIHIA